MPIFSIVVKILSVHSDIKHFEQHLELYTGPLVLLLALP